MNTMQTYSGLTDFLIKHNGKNDTNNITHTRIGDKTLNIYGGSYSIPKDEIDTFYRLYTEHIFTKKQSEYLTEKQIDNGPLLIDFDFRYSFDTTERQHTKEHIDDIVVLYLEELKNFFIFEENKPFDVFAMEKKNVNRTSLADKQLTKDGIHLMIGVQMDHTMQVMLRERILKKIGSTWELPLLNDWEAVLDEGISKGSTNWQLYGSKKPGNEAYELTHHYSACYTEDSEEFEITEEDVETFNVIRNFKKLSVQNDENPRFEINPTIITEYNARLTSSKPKKTLLTEDGATGGGGSSYDCLENINTKEDLQNAMNQILQSLSVSEYSIREIHEYTQILPAKYYESGSHLLNRQVAFALKSTDDRLFLSWIMLRSKADDFDYGTIPKLFQDWNRHFHLRQDGITKKSIIYWAKQDAFEEYKKVKQNTVDSFVEETLHNTNEFDLATVLYHMFKDKYVCSSISNKQFYIFKNHRWEQDKGMSLRMAISKDMFHVYNNINQRYIAERQKNEDNEEKLKSLQEKIKKISEVSNRLKKTTDKNNIMREAMELFYDNEFIKNMDANKYLMCFSNGVVDFKNKVFRDGYPQDYITKSTNIPYVQFDEHKHKTMSDQITIFMQQLFPIADLNTYMWNHLASCLIGTNMNQTFNIYCGSGSNGKSLLTDLMSHALGEYKGTVPITLVTEKRNSIGGTSSEVMQLKGIRYAVMQEPSKESRINEGVMKELTGGDPIQGRALYCDSEIFEPQFKLVVCTNSLFEFGSNDDGTWRRIRKCDFVSKFVDSDETYNDDTEYIFPKDKGLKEKLPVWAPIFVSMLVSIAFQSEGVVKDCDVVLDSSNKYRQGQDHISAFVNEMIIKQVGKKLGKREVSQQFQLWFQENNGRQRKMPKGTELHDYIDKKFGKCKLSKWANITLAYPTGEEEDDDDN
jgi:P4 family phage/plasmid primase-like protien